MKFPPKKVVVVRSTFTIHGAHSKYYSYTQDTVPREYHSMSSINNCTDSIETFVRPLEKGKKVSGWINNEEETAVVTSCNFDSLIDDNLLHIFGYVGKKSYGGFGSINKRCNNIFNTQQKNTPKKSCFYNCLNLEQLKKRALTLGISCMNIESARSIAQFGRFDFLDWWFEQHGDDSPSSREVMAYLCSEIGRVGNVVFFRKVFDYLDEIHRFDRCIREEEILSCRGKKRPDGLMLLAGAAKGKSLEILKWLQNERDFILHSSTCIAAAGSGSLKVLKYTRLYSTCGLKKKACFREALKSRCLPILKWIHKQMRESDLDDPDYIMLAAKCGYVEILDWLKENGFKLTLVMCIEMSCGNKYSTEVHNWANRQHMKELHPYPKENYDNLFLEALKNKSFEALKYIHQQMEIPDLHNPLYCAIATAPVCSVEILRWLKENDYELNMMECLLHAIEYKRQDARKTKKSCICGFKKVLMYLKEEFATENERAVIQHLLREREPNSALVLLEMIVSVF